MSVKMVLQKDQKLLSDIFSTILSHISNLHGLKSVQIWSFFWAVFYSICTKYEDLQSKFPHSGRIWENADQKKLSIWTLRAVLSQGSSLFHSGTN